MIQYHDSGYNGKFSRITSISHIYPFRAPLIGVLERPAPQRRCATSCGVDRWELSPGSPQDSPRDVFRRMEVTDGYPAWLCQQFAIENGPVEIVDLPIEHGDFL